MELGRDRVAVKVESWVGWRLVGKTTNNDVPLRRIMSLPLMESQTNRPHL